MNGTQVAPDDNLLIEITGLAVTGAETLGLAPKLVAADSASSVLGLAVLGGALPAVVRTEVRALGGPESSWKM